VKHADPCGVAIGDTLLSAYANAFTTDPSASFGGVIAFNQNLDEETAQAILDKQFVEVIIAPEISTEAQSILKQKPNIRILSCGHWSQQASDEYDCKRIHGGMLLQTYESHEISASDLKIVTEQQPTQQQLTDLLFANKVVKFVRSNAIVYANNESTISIGGGQTSRVDSVRIANMKAQNNKIDLHGCVMASDAFFPFADGVELAIQAGVCAIIQPGGSMRDKEVIAAANKAGIVMGFTGVRYFHH
ncbi:MAG: bifunctional phosphoribosylaminoimidazolecarboxamide formyltransferase/IMP cyclohydrolase, partial [Gammaproteobacteria bacterium]